ncbi:MAG: proton-conducting membrane transporter [Lachnospiraceae bacterium]|nr:proton-conducting membrane transporter [Lachnospiraceae bacterium]
MLLGLSMLLPAVAGTVISILYKDDPRQEAEKRRERTAGRNRLYGALAVVTAVLCLLAVRFSGTVTPLVLTEGVNVTFGLDGMGRFVLIAVVLLYTCVCFYGFEYMGHEERPHIFYAFYFVSYSALIACCMAGNLLTLYFCFEMLTLSSMPLVLHELTKESVTAALKYMFYSIAGALLGLLAVFFVYRYGPGSHEFVAGGFLRPEDIAQNRQVFLEVIMAGIIGFGTKAGLYPMHGWLPAAHPIAPAPASAVLSGIIAKAGVLSIARLVYYSVGADNLRGTWVQTAWMTLTLLTIFMGSMMAFREKILKKRLAYSTISQISYVLLSLSFLGDGGMRGAMLHLMSHAASKGCLFLVAGIFIVKLGIRNVDDLKGVGRRMPVTLWCFTIASLSLVGIPPMGGFLSKWVIAENAIGSGIPVYSVLAPVILLISALLTAGYLLPITVDGFFPGHAEEEHHAGGKQQESQDAASLPSAEPSYVMLIPLMILCTAALVMGVFGIQIAGLFGF